MFHFWKNATPVRKANIVLAVVAMCLLAGIAYRLWGPPSPEQVRDEAIRAFQTKDMETLIRLTDAEEMTKLQLTPEKVNTLLRETLWARDVPEISKLHLFADKPIDRRTWILSFVGDNGRYTFGITVVDDRKIGWKLVLSDSLYLAYRRSKERKEIAYDIHKRWPALGIRGTRDQRGNYDFFNSQNL